MNRQSTGYVIKYFEDKGFGFVIESSTEKEYFFHRSCIEFDTEKTPLTIGTTVAFNFGSNEKGIMASNIILHQEEKAQSRQIVMPNARAFIKNISFEKCVIDRDALKSQLGKILPSKQVAIGLKNNALVVIKSLTCRALVSIGNKMINVSNKVK